MCDWNSQITGIFEQIRAGEQVSYPIQSDFQNSATIIAMIVGRSSRPDRSIARHDATVFGTVHV